MDDTTVLLQATDINKSFPGVQALVDVDFTLRHGEIHALLGENGAGTSTLIKVLTGVEQADSGAILLEGEQIEPRSPQHAHTLGISAVFQEINLCDNLSVAENMFIGNEPRKRGRIDWSAMNQQARDLLARLDVDIDVSQLLGLYSVAMQQMVAIARALSISAKVVILDEPTSSLDAQEVEKLFAVMRNLRADGIGIIFITHFLDQVDAVSDRITVLRNGRLVGAYDAGELTRMQLIAKMIGKNLDDLTTLSRMKEDEASGIRAEAILNANGLARTGSIAPFDMQMHTGEVLGLAGLLGSGRTETANLLFGIDKPDKGELTINGTPVTRHTPPKAIELGIGLCPEDRKADGIIPDLTVRENIILALQSSRGWLRALGSKEQNEIADTYIEALSISTPTAEQLVKNLSGGNQQKVILARWLATDPEILILDEPTRGIDVGTKAEIQKLVIELAGEGKAVLFISSELDEVVRCSHRVIVLRDGHHVAELVGDEIAVGPIMELIAGEDQESE